MSSSPRPRSLPALVPRLVSLWLGLPVLAFLLWSWRDSMAHAATLNWVQGKPFQMVWPPADPHRLQSARPILSSADTRLTMPEIEVPSIDTLLSQPSYYDASLPASEQMPLKPHRNLPLNFDNPWQATPSWVQRYLSLGSKGSVIYLSTRIVPAPRIPAWTYLRDQADAPWFPAPEYSHHEAMQSRTLRLPYWLLLTVFLPAWSLLLLWRARRLHKRLSNLTPA
jgi:hypothetical protein